MARRAGETQTTEQLGKTLKPQITLHQVPCIRLRLPDATWKHVAAMSAEEFLDAVELLIACLSIVVQDRARNILYAFDYRVVIEGVSYERWYALDELMRLGVKLPLSL